MTKYQNDGMLVDFNLSRKFFSHDGLTLSYLDNECPSSYVPVVMLHGFTASAESNWLKSDWIKKLTQAGRRVLAFDARGHGHSDKPHDSRYYPSDIMMQDSVTLLKSMGVQKADFIGYSMGARMSAFVAIKHPNLVQKLVLGGMGINLKNGTGNPQPIADALLAPNLRDVKNRGARRFRRLAELGNNDLTALAHCILSSRQAITDEKLEGISAKTCIIVGDSDEVGGSPFELAPFIANSQAISITDCHHFNALTHPEFRQSALNFILTE